MAIKSQQPQRTETLRTQAVPGRHLLTLGTFSRTQTFLMGFYRGEDLWPHMLIFVHTGKLSSMGDVPNTLHSCHTSLDPVPSALPP